MNTNQNNDSQTQDTEKLKEIQKWTRIYAENRTLPFLINMSTSLFLFIALGGLFYVAGNAYRAQNMLLCWICISAAAIVFIAGMCASTFIERRLYRKEGQVKLALPEKTKKHRLAGVIAGLILIICIIISVLLVVFCNLPVKYMQPISALCVIPLIIAVGIWQPPSIKPAGFLVWLWPTLYVIHAILIVAGVPIHFNHPWIFLNIAVPIAGYGILCAFIGHIYSRYALKKLKGLTHLEGDAANGD